jgi:hypothetical protein
VREAKTYGQMMDEALAIKTQEEADKWFLEEVKFMQEANPDWSPEKCAEVVRSNLGYMAGYYSREVSEHVHKFWGANHPVFGGPGYWGKVTPKEAFEAGKKMAKDCAGNGDGK